MTKRSRLMPKMRVEIVLRMLQPMALLLAFCALRGIEKSNRRAQAPSALHSFCQNITPTLKPQTVRDPNVNVLYGRPIDQKVRAR